MRLSCSCCFLDVQGDFCYPEVFQGCLNQSVSDFRLLKNIWECLHIHSEIYDNETYMCAFVCRILFFWCVSKLEWHGQ